MSGKYIISRDFEHAVLDLVAEVASAETKCAAQLARLPEDEWERAKSTIQNWIDLDTPQSSGWRQVFKMAEWQRAAA